MSSERNIANDLLNLEINIILVDGISSCKMPPPEQALQRIVEKYDPFLQRTLQNTKKSLIEASLRDPEIQEKLDMLESPEKNDPAKEQSKSENFKTTYKVLGGQAKALMDLRTCPAGEGVGL